MDDTALIKKIAASTLRRRGVAWEPGATLAQQAEEAAAAAIGLLRGIAGNQALPFSDDEDFDLAVIACWYLMDNRRAEFTLEYKGELLYLRAREAVADAGV